MTDTTRLRTIFLGMIALILTAAALHAMTAVFVPAVLAFFVALVAAPLDRWVRASVPPMLGWLGQLAAVLAVLAALAVFAAGIGLAAKQAMQVFDNLPEGVITAVQQAASGEGGDAAAAAGAALEQTAADHEAAQGATTEVFGIPLSRIAGLIGGQAVGMMAEVAKLIAASTGTLISGVILVVLLMALMLAERGRWQRLLVGQLTRSTEEEVEEALSQIAHKLRIFIVTRAALGLVTAVFYGAWLWWFDVDLLLVWMLLAVLLNFIPTVGSIIAGGLPVLYAMVTRDPGTVALIAFGLFMLEQILGNVVDPYVQGKQVSVSPVVVLVGLLLWGWIWGITGTLLATPMTIVIVVICAHIPATRTFALMLSDKSDLDDLLVNTGVRAA
ncbi:AI-2 transport protein TqsA [Loktanella atrilutea]|uniref:AI-2 transport protein TqsA n=1 Tax=Loktanella atrilutea TaxID=366533 RepID=A0A1M4SVP8_LOKAT|nr:AI-2E family transporter [Loktanella atrilutea]SHE36243.1 AI-2 transport protein TqsA [Loktanella atrilutea]